MANNSGTAVPTRNVVQEDALAIAVQHKRCGLAISMGVGKTRIAIQHLQRYYDQFIQVLVVVPKHSVAQSWIDELGKMGLESLVKHITFTTYISLKKREPQ
jgi:superfamily II DNA or RNA helicase